MSDDRPPLPRLSEREAAWVGGILSFFGALAVFGTTPSKIMRETPTLKLTFQSRLRPEGIKKLGKMLKKGIGNSKHRGLWFTITGAEVDDLYKQVWPFLTEERKLEYGAALGHRDKVMKDLQDKLRYERERAATPISTPEQQRERREALYDGSDPAVQLVPEGFDPDMAIDSELERAKQRREQQAQEDKPEYDFSRIAAHQGKKKR